MNAIKKIFLVGLAVLSIVSCNELSMSHNRSMEAFEFSQNCPKVCFMGIEPSVTTPIEALHILKNSPDIDSKTISILYNNGNDLAKNIDESSLALMKQGGILEARWMPTSEDFGFYIHISATNNIIDYVDAQPMSKTIKDFVEIIGEPDRIKVSGMQPPDASYWIYYSVFYAKWKLIINISATSIDGPKADDAVGYVLLNQEINEADFRQWQGYGKIRLYMTNEQLKDYQSFTQDYSTGNP